jgi:hypothetical protein
LLIPSKTPFRETVIHNSVRSHRHGQIFCNSIIQLFFNCLQHLAGTVCTNYCQIPLLLTSHKIETIAFSCCDVCNNYKQKSLASKTQKDTGSKPIANFHLSGRTHHCTQKNPLLSDWLVSRAIGQSTEWIGGISTGAAPSEVFIKALGWWLQQLVLLRESNQRPIACLVFSFT